MSLRDTTRRMVGTAAAALFSICAEAPEPRDRVAMSTGGTGAQIEWVRLFASAGDDWVNDLVPLHNGHVAAVGFLNRDDQAERQDWLALAAELSADGASVTEARYGAQGGMDAFWSMAEGADGRRYFAGFTSRIGPAGINGFILVADRDGAIQKENGVGQGGYDRFTDLAAAADGFVFVGHSQLPDEGAKRRVYIVRTDAAGLPVWERIYGGPETWSALYVEPAGDGGYIIAGGTDGGGDADMFVMKIDSNGRELWRKRVGTPLWDEINHGLIVRPDGRILLVGYTHARGDDANDLVAATLTPDGEVERLERFGGDADDRAILVKAGADGRAWIVGQTASTGAGGTDLLLTSLDGDGRFEGSVLTLGGAANDNGTAVLPLSSDSLLLAGYSGGLGRRGQDAFVARVRLRGEQRRHPSFCRTVVREP